MFLLFLYLLIFLNFGLTFNFTVKYEVLLKDYKAYCAKRNCFFGEQEITQKTMEKWPTKCGDVCLLMVLNQNTDVPVDVWKEKLKKTERIMGGVWIVNTSLENLEFIKKDVLIFTDYNEFVIQNNSKLTNADPILGMIPMGIKSLKILDNPIFDATAYCNSYEYDLKGWEIRGNKVDCHCRAEKLTSKNLQKYTDCEHIGGSLIITDLEDKIPPMSKVKKIGGTLEVRNTNLKNLSFFESLKQIEYITELESKRIIINIYNNLEMTRLGIPHLEALGVYFDDGYVLNFKNLHPDFCVTVREMSMFIDYKVAFRNLHASFCTDWNWSIDQPKLCLFDRMSTLDTGCVFIFGNLLIGPGDEEYVRKLKIVRRVFGAVNVWNTTLENCHFLRQLENVVNLNDSVPVMQFLGNLNLKNLQFPSLKKFIVRGNNHVIVEGNHPDAFLKTRFCMAFQVNAGTNITYNGGNCKSINRTHPNGTGFDFDNFDYQDFEFDYQNDNWKNEYDGDFWFLVETPGYKKLFKRLNQLNDYIALIGLIINFFHLIVLFQKELRGSFVYIMMIGISICDVILVSTFLLSYLLVKIMGPDTEYCYTWPYWYAMFKLLYDRILSMARRCSTILAFLMALFRTISVMFPLSVTVPKVTRPRVIILLSLACFIVCLSWDALIASRCKIIRTEFTCEDYKDPPPDYYHDCEEDDVYDDFTVPVNKTSDLFEGFSTVIISVLYLTVTIALSYQLIAARKRKRSLKYEKSENFATLLLVTALALSFFSSELVFGAFYLVKALWSSKYKYLQDILDEYKILCWTFLIINSSVHCLICFFMSTQYRNVARRVFWFGKKKAQVDVLFVNRDILEPTVQ